MSKFEIAMITLFVGYFLGQATDFLKFKYTTRRKKTALIREVKDHLAHMHYLTDRLCKIAKDVSDPNVLGTPIPNTIKTVIFDNFFPDILPFLTDCERKQVFEHYGTIESFNSEVTELVNGKSININKAIVNLYYYCCLITETARNFETETKKGLIKDDLELVNFLNSKVSDFSQKYNLLNENS